MTVFLEWVLNYAVHGNNLSSGGEADVEVNYFAIDHWGLYRGAWSWRQVKFGVERNEIRPMNTGLEMLGRVKGGVWCRGAHLEARIAPSNMLNRSSCPLWRFEYKCRCCFWDNAHFPMAPSTEILDLLPKSCHGQRDYIRYVAVSRNLRPDSTYSTL